MPNKELKYCEYFNVNEKYFPCIDESAINSGVSWQATYPHEAFISLLNGAEKMLGGITNKSLWIHGAYSGMHYEEPNAPHTVIQASDGVNWYAMQPNAEPPAFEHGAEAAEYNCAQFREFIPGYEREITTVDGTYSSEGHFEVRHNDGSGTMFYDTARYRRDTFLT